MSSSVAVEIGEGAPLNGNKNAGIERRAGLLRFFRHTTEERQKRGLPELLALGQPPPERWPGTGFIRKLRTR